MGRLSQVSKLMIKMALNVGSHHSHTGQRVLRKIVMEKGSGSGSKLEVRALAVDQRAPVQSQTIEFAFAWVGGWAAEGGCKKQQKAFSEVSGSRARIPKGSPGPPFLHLNVSSAFESTV